MTGELAALACATSFAFCSLAFAAAGREVGSMVVNQLRVFLAAVFLLGVHYASEGSFWPTSMNGEQIWLLVTSGCVGLALGDLFYFHSIAVIGPRVGTLLMATNPVFVVCAEGLGREHWPTGTELVFMAAILLGVMLVLVGKPAIGGWRPPPGKSRNVAIVAGLLGAVGQGVGLVLSKMGEDVSQDAPQSPLSVTLVRMLAGLAGIALLAAVQRSSRRPGARPPMTRRAFWMIMTGVVFGPTLGVWLSMVAIQRSNAGLTSVLLGLTPVLMLPIGYVAHRERPTAQAWAGTLLAFAGTAALILGRDASG